MMMTQRGKANMRRKRGSVDGTKGCDPNRNKDGAFDWSLKVHGELKWFKSGLCFTNSAFVFL